MDRGTGVSQHPSKQTAVSKEENVTFGVPRSSWPALVLKKLKKQPGDEAMLPGTFPVILKIF